jgi:hypothetical protein
MRIITKVETIIVSLRLTLFRKQIKVSEFIWSTVLL